MKRVYIFNQKESFRFFNAINDILKKSISLGQNTHLTISNIRNIVDKKKIKNKKWFFFSIQNLK